MSWELLAIFVALCWGIENLIIKYIMKTQSSLVYTWIFNITSMAFFFLISVKEINFPSDYFAWFIVLFASIIYILSNLAGFESYRRTDISVSHPLSRTSVFFTLILSVFILNENLSFNKILGAFLLFIGVIILTWHKNPLKGFSHRGVQLTLINAFLIGLVAIIDKIGISYFTPAFYGFLVFFIPTVILTPFVLPRFDRVKASFQRMKLPMLAVSLFGSLGYLGALTAFTLTEVSNVVIVIQLSIIITVFGGYFFHKERNLFRRLIGALFVIAGTALVIKPIF